jgi:hypothetical protein
MYKVNVQVWYLGDASFGYQPVYPLPQIRNFVVFLKPDRKIRLVMSISPS